MPSLPTLNFFSDRATNEMLMRQNNPNLEGSGQYYIYNLSPFVRKYPK